MSPLKVTVKHSSASVAQQTVYFSDSPYAESRSYYKASIVLVILCLAASVLIISQYFMIFRFNDNNKLQPCNQSIHDKILALEMIELRENYYFFSKIKKTWIKAKTECAARGLKLVDFHDKQQSEIVTQYLENLHVSGLQWTAFWTSGKEISSETYEWTTLGQPLNISNWQNNKSFKFEVTPLEINNVTDEENYISKQLTFEGKCIEIDIYGSIITLKPSNCNWRRRYICEMSIPCQNWVY